MADVHVSVTVAELVCEASGDTAALLVELVESVDERELDGTARDENCDGVEESEALKVAVEDEDAVETGAA